MSITFINREREKEILEKRFKSKKPEFIVLYGRRRIGKTELIKFLQKNKKHVYYLADKTNDKQQLDKIVNSVSELFQERKPVIHDWEEFFEYISEKAKQRLIFVVDEFPYLIKSNKAITSIFQKGWDEYLKNSKIFLILCGSSVSIMEDKVLAYKSPLYGRRTGQLKLTALKFKDAIKFFPNYSFEDKIKSYAVLGGIPFYLKQFNDKISVIENIKKIFSIDSILFQEPEFLLKEEFREPQVYSKIMEAIAFGNTKLNEISIKTQMDVHKLPKYIELLIKLKFVEKISPVTIKKPKTKQTQYKIIDNFFKFWYKFIYPNKSEIESGEIKKIFKNFDKQFNSFLGKIFEDLCIEFIKEKQFSNSLNFTKIGKQWGKFKGEKGKTYEIDVCALNEEAKQILFGECKWKEKVNALTIANELNEKTKHVDWNKETRKEFLAIFAKSFSKKITEFKGKKVYCYDLKDMQKTLK